jgi:hypothetical protein
MGEHLGVLPATEARAMRGSARAIRAAIRADLWDPKAK